MAINYPQRYDDDFLNTIKTVIDHVNIHGKTIQDLVAEGQLTEEQYGQLLTTINGLLKSGGVDEVDLSDALRADLKSMNESINNKADLSSVNQSLLIKANYEDLESFQEQLNNIIAQSGTSDTETVNARTRLNGNITSTLKERLDEDYIYNLLKAEYVEGTTQKVKYDNGDVVQIRHERHSDGSDTRIDDLNWSASQVVETRTLFNGRKMVLTTNLSTYETVVGFL